MNRNSKLLSFALLVAMAGAGTSCKKSTDNVPNTTVCHIVQVEEMDGSNIQKYNVVYDAEGRISIINTESSVKTFTYTGNVIITPQVFTFGMVDSIVLNSQGLIAAVYTIFPGSPAFGGESYSYNDDGTIASITDVSSATTHTMYQSSGGNITSKKDIFGGQEETYKYDTKYGWMDGDVMKWEQMKKYGSAYFFKPKNLWKGTLIAPITYTFDSTGRIATATPFPTPFLADKYTFTYECN